MNCTGKCDICQLNVHKYKCPRCEMKTCSLTCCNKHKIDTNCNGQRDRTKFTIKEEISQYTALRLENTKNLSDFWRTQQKRLPILASAVRKFCIIPASSVPSESRFSIANYAARKERSNLTSKNLRYLMIS